jgi:predicted secreted hydrolase
VRGDGGDRRFARGLVSGTSTGANVAVGCFEAGMKALAFLWCLVMLAACDNGTPRSDAPIVSLHAELGGDATGFQRACAPVAFRFPEDHIDHPGFRNEWWYITGNVVDVDGTRYGFHVTFFRVATQPHTPKQSGSAWETSQFYMAHFAVTREADTAVAAHERFSRTAAGLAGAVLERKLAKVWLEDWKLVQISSGTLPTWELRLSDAASGTAIDLKLAALKPRVLQGTEGYSRKSDDPCNASHYYAYTRLSAEGSISSSGQTFDVTGSAWFDREWSSSALSDNQVGWDWFAMQFDDGRELMFYQLRQSDGTASPYSSAVEIGVDGRKQAVAVPQLEISRWWQSSSGARYPVEGKLSRSDNGETVYFSPLIDNQELNLTVRYWEGAIMLTDDQGRSVGRGYLELTGY